MVIGAVKEEVSFDIVDIVTDIHCFSFPLT